MSARWLAAGVALAAMLSACGGGSSNPTLPPAPPPTPTTPATPPPPAPPPVPKPADLAQHATAKGSPAGNVAQATLGPAGGSLNSADGAVTLTVPAGALGTDTVVSIQPLDNTAHGGLGRAYRLQPEGLQTARPMRLSFHYDAGGDAIAATPQQLGVAYQDAYRLWRPMPQPVIDTTQHTVTVQTTHFSDWSAFVGLQLRPPAGELEVGQTLTLEIQSCEQVLMDDIGKLVTILAACKTWANPGGDIQWQVNGAPGGNSSIGTVTGLASTTTPADAVYTAPAEVPGNADRLVVDVAAEVRDPATTGSPVTILISHVAVNRPLATSCEWLRNVEAMDLDISFDPIDVQSGDDADRLHSRHAGQMTLRLRRQTQSKDIDAWVSDGHGGAGRVQINDDERQFYSRTQTMGDGPPAEGSVAILEVLYTNCTYLIDSSFTVQATKRTDYFNGVDNPPETQELVLRIGRLTKGFTPIYANAAVLRRLQGERTGSIGLEPSGQLDALFYVPEQLRDAPTPTDGLNVRWIARPAD
ncbi:hypothetical protein [Pelomonas cellulosilytica]|uniref:ZU5 domain-containing protein n=1 Tax=Pelomonas cellulosilytica TaxID=2906762 RepID=A0ABS8XZN9_9BURK|nr:hypothetical protein [Pelomonas sp. P8]MCE4556246.1 hypothetical protein [Pelomonas sp. P8]